MSFVVNLLERENALALLKARTSAGGQEAISDDLRGWRWQEVLSPVQKRAPFNSLSYGYCPTRRDLFLTFKGKPRRETLATIAGRAYDRALKLPGERIREIVLSTDPSKIDPDSYMKERDSITLEAGIGEQQGKAITFNEGSEVSANVSKLVAFEMAAWTSRLEYWLARTPSLSKEKLARMVIPLEFDRPIEAEDMGYTNQLTPDFYQIEDSAIGDLKTGERQDQHKLAVTSYALAYEHTVKKPIDVGFVMYFEPTKKAIPRFRVETFGISNEFRRAAIQYRNEGLKLLLTEEPPPLADKEICAGCVFLNECRPGEDAATS